MSISPTQLSLSKLRGDGWTAEVVERYNFFSKKRHDLYGFIDILAVGPEGTLAVQTTSYSNVSSRVRKISEHENVGAVRDAGWRIVVHGWRKKNNRWVCREVDIS